MSIRTTTSKSSKCSSPILQSRESKTTCFSDSKTTSAKSNGIRTMTSESVASGRSCKSGLKIQEPNGEVYALIRFKNEHTQVIRNACIKEKRVVQNYAYGGEFIGIADKVQPVCGDLNGTNSRCGLLMIKFPSKEKAKLWFQSDSVFRQGDFPRPSGEIGLALIPLHYIPLKSGQDTDGVRTFEMIEICNIADNSRLQTEYVDKMAALMDKQFLRHGVVATSESSSPRFTWLHPDNYVVLNEYKDCDEFNKLQTKAEYFEITEAGRALCRMNSILFTVDPRIAK